MSLFGDSGQSGLEAVIRRLLQEPRECFGGQVRSILPVARIRRPFSEVTKLEVELEGSRRKIVIKQFRLKNGSPAHKRKMEERVRKDFDVTRFFHEQFADCAGYSTPEPIICYPELLAIVMVLSPGENLGDLIAKKARLYPSKATLQRLSDGSRACGRYLRRLQNITAETGKLDLEELIQDVDLRLKTIVARDDGVIDPGLRRGLLAHCEKQALLAAESDLGLCGVHGDYCAGNILVGRDAVTVLDFTMFKTGSKYHDVTYYCRNLANFLHKPIFRPKTISVLQRAFLNGYDENLEAENPVFKLLSLRHVACHLRGVLEARAPWHVRLFNRRVARRHGDWMRNAIADCHRDLLA